MWLIEMHEQNKQWSQVLLAEKFTEKYKGELLKTSTISDWLKPDAVARVRSVLAAGLYHLIVRRCQHTRYRS
jgi:hypothetical protein